MDLQFRKFQEGGAMPPAEQQVPENGGQPQSGGDPIMQLAQLAAQALQSQDCNAAMQVCQAFVQMLQQAQGGGAAEQPQGEPVYRKGGVLVKRIVKQ